MTLREKVAQLSGVWVGVAATGADVAPQQHELAALPAPWEDLVAAGIGQLTRPFGSAPVDPVEGAQALAETQRTIMAANRWGIPALVHEECLTGTRGGRSWCHRRHRGSMTVECRSQPGGAPPPPGKAG